MFLLCEIGRSRYILEKDRDVVVDSSRPATNNASRPARHTQRSDTKGSAMFVCIGVAIGIKISECERHKILGKGKLA